MHMRLELRPPRNYIMNNEALSTIRTLPLQLAGSMFNNSGKIRHGSRTLIYELK